MDEQAQVIDEDAHGLVAEFVPPPGDASTVHTVPVIVALGASAGGLDAFNTFFHQMPALSGMAFVVIQHLAPQHTSILVELIQRCTEMPTRQAENDMQVEPNTVYVIPPNAMLAIFNGRLQLLEPTEGMNLRLPIDYFFRALADDVQERAVGIILSGTGSDGTLGLKAIKERGGLIIVQDPVSAGYDGMPQSAIATGMVDFILATAQMPEQLALFKRLALDAETQISISKQETHPEFFQQILLLVRSHTGHDFLHYKQSTILRRIERLMAVNQIQEISEYARFLQNNVLGIEALFRDLLIGVTNFFRDREAYESLKQSVIPALFQNRRADQPIRIWVAGCSTGEEAYSIAILLREHMAVLKQEFRVQIFATDIDARAISSARLGVYPMNIDMDVPETYIQQYFLTTAEGYQVVKSLREMLIFALHSATKDPPFSRLDLISCRNLLIYLDAGLQEKVLSFFQYALSPEGFLLLGTSESLGRQDRQFRVVDAQHKLFQRASGGAQVRFQSKLPSGAPRTTEKITPVVRPLPRQMSLEERVRALLLKNWTPTCIVINDQGRLRYVHGRTGKYLEIASGDIDQLDITSSAREGLKMPLTHAIYRAAMQKREIYEPGIRVKTDDGEVVINLTVMPLSEVTSGEALLGVFFEEIALLDPRLLPKETSLPALDEREQKFILLQHELNDTREYLQATIEELRSSNEELQSTNEEMQSVNEELETSQEELKAVNEELLTVNSELERKVTELASANNDLANTLNAVQTGIVLLDGEFRVRRFNPAATQVFRLIAADIGRSIGDVVFDLNYAALLQDVEAVFTSLVPHETDVQSGTGRWFALQIRPYRTVQNAIRGVVISFNDITKRKQMEAK